jgi:hypothetical protein
MRNVLIVSVIKIQVARGFELNLGNHTYVRPSYACRHAPIYRARASTSYLIRIDFVGPDFKKIPLGEMQSKSQNGMVKLKLAYFCRKNQISLDPNFKRTL